ncbi:MAG: helix-turn-helix transcriptional regulator [Clostridiales bacterium]|jgi:DNA-binding XRE family transcriptional regulator|nr:helix-turn-helix transcriptional regulator [Clostridiales bacterium]
MYNESLGVCLEDFQDNLKQARELLELSINQLSEYMDVTRQTISNLEGKKNPLSLTSALAFSSVFDFSSENKRSALMSLFLIAEEDVFRKMTFNSSKGAWSPPSNLVEAWMTSFYNDDEAISFKKSKVGEPEKMLKSESVFWDITQIPNKGFRILCQRVVERGAFINIWHNDQKSIQMLLSANSPTMIDVITTIRRSENLVPRVWGGKSEADSIVDAIYEEISGSQAKTTFITNNFKSILEGHYKGFKVYCLNRDGTLISASPYMSFISNNVKEKVFEKGQGELGEYVSELFSSK